MYAKCDYIQRTKPIYEVDAELYKQISSGYRLLPSFESSISNCVLKKHYSLQINSHLKCRWTEYKRNIESRVFAPYRFPDIRDLHFYNGAIRIYPEASIHLADHRMKLIPGPGVDSRGHLPIPQDALMKRGKLEKAAKNNKKAPKKNLNISKIVKTPLKK